MSGSARMVVNGRFLTMQMTGVQRYARSLLEHLPGQVDGEVLVAIPPNNLVDGADRDGLASLSGGERWHGARGHAWEQVVLPQLVRRAGRPPLLSPASWGPLACKRQIVFVHDLLPLQHGEYFTPAYRTMTKMLLPALVRRGVAMATSSQSARTDMASRYRLDPDTIALLPPGIGAPFSTWPVDDLANRTGDYCLLVGSHDRRKNVGFVLDWWAKARDETGLDLVVTTRGSSSVRRNDDPVNAEGVRVVSNPSDHELAALYANALCLLWPSVAEGYGLPLLECMAVGTPFLSTDTGAASELALDPGQILPLEPARWLAMLRRWRENGVVKQREDAVARARSHTWENTAAATVRVVAQLG